MKNHAKKISALFLIILAAGTVEAQNYFPEDLYKQLEQEGEITKTFKGADQLSLLPDINISREIRADINALDPKIGVEILYIMDLPGHIKTMSSLEKDLHLYNTMRKISRMQGIEYYSRSREKMRLLFEKSYLVEKLKSKTALPDSLVENIPEQDRLVCFQKDLSFGTNFYQLDYSYSPGTITLRYMNLDSMYYSIIKAVSPGNLNIYLVVLYTEEKLIIYGLSAADVFSLFGFKKKAEGSFYERLKAIRNWFIDIM